MECDERNTGRWRVGGRYISLFKKYERIKNLKIVLMKTTSEFLCKSARIKIIIFLNLF